MNEQEQLNTLKDIRSLMEKSSRFLSLSGLSGIFIGLCALAGAFLIGNYVSRANYDITEYHKLAFKPDGDTNNEFINYSVKVAATVLILSIITGIYFTRRKAKKYNLKIWDTTAKRMLINLCIPLFAGGIYILILLKNLELNLVAPTMLLFFGLALVNAGKYTFNDIRYLGVIEILLGLIACLYPGFGLIFWAIGFGALLIIYGAWMHFKYEK